MNRALVSYKDIGRQAWPLILANAAVPILGLVDTAVIGNVGSVTDLGAIAIGALIFSFVYWGFGFLRMGTTGFTAQAAGAQDHDEVRALFGRSLLIAVVLGLMLVAMQWPIQWLAFKFLDASDSVESVAQNYFQVRIWGAPATLSNFVLIGVLIGLGQSRQLLRVQLFLNGLNILLDLFFAGYLEMGATGVALGTVIAEWFTVVYGASVVVAQLSLSKVEGSEFWPLAKIFQLNRIKELATANLDIMIRTLLLVFSFAFFTNQSAQFGDVTLAANHILLQLVSFSAFFLDGFAFVAEALAGRALGAKDRPSFDIAVHRSTVMAFVAACVLAMAIYLLGGVAVAGLTDLSNVQVEANALRWLAALYVLLSFVAFQLDGVFIGVSFTAEMRQAALYAVVVYLVAWYFLVDAAGVVGLWWAMIIYVVARALTLLYYYPRIRLKMQI